MTEPKDTQPDTYDPQYDVRDDAVVGKALAWSAVVIVLIGGGIAAWRLWPKAEEAPQVIVEKDAGAIDELKADVDAMPNVHFTDITREAGVNFVHTNGAAGDKLLPETMGGGCAFLDYDNDGDQDLLLVNATHWPDAEYDGPPPTLALYANDGSGAFTDVTAEVGLDISIYGMGCAVGDYDNDGLVDIFITAVGRNRLFRNTGSAFVDVSDEAGVDPNDERWSATAGFFDYDRDGDLDLFVCNYVKWSKEIDESIHSTTLGDDRAYGQPIYFTGDHCALYRNNGAGAFDEVSESAGLHITNDATGVPVGKALGVAIVDIDRDGWIDVIVANDTVRNFLFRNKGDGSFEEFGAESGLGYDSDGNATGAMGIDAAYYRNDDSIAVGIGNFAKEMTSFYVSQRDPMFFSDQATVDGVGSPSRQKLSFGLFFFDYDLDGRLDLLQANGHLEETINQKEASQHYEQAPQLFWNCGPDARTSYSMVPENATGDLGKKIVGRGAAYADIDGDGDLDVLLTQTGRAPMLLRNDQQLNHHWLRFKLVGAESNRDAIGAMIEVDIEVDGAAQTMRRRVMPTRSYISQMELPVTFGLGDVDRVDAVRITWPNGRTQTLTEVAIDQLNVIEEPARGG